MALADVIREDYLKIEITDNFQMHQECGEKFHSKISRLNQHFFVLFSLEFQENLKYI